MCTKNVQVFPATGQLELGAMDVFTLLPKVQIGNQIHRLHHSMLFETIFSWTNENGFCHLWDIHPLRTFYHNVQDTDLFAYKYWNEIRQKVVQNDVQCIWTRKTNQRCTTPADKKPRAKTKDTKMITMYSCCQRSWQRVRLELSGPESDEHSQDRNKPV